MGGGVIDYIKDSNDTYLFPITKIESIYDTNGNTLQSILDNKQPKGDYSLASHNHDSVYSKLDHSHSNYALSNHNHDSAYAAKYHSHQKLGIIDTRNLNSTPSDYYGDSSKIGNCIFTEFKSTTVINFRAGGQFTGVTTILPWSDSSGGNAYQFGCGYDSNTSPRIKVRTNSLQATSWSAWYDIYHSNYPQCTVQSSSPSWAGSYNERLWAY